jgi:16S rRNA (guanine527-N7)-methyltransferase
MTEKLIESIRHYQADFGLRLENTDLEKLANYFELVQKHNPILHLVAPGSEADFAVRHILESLTLLEFLPVNAKFADVGTGAGLPSIPCLLVREDLRGTLIESKLKKAAFLEEVVSKCGLENRTNIINRQFEEISKPAVSFITCRALDKFTQKLPKLLKWSKGANLLFFGGPLLREELRKNRVKFNEKLLPLSEQRYLFTGKI